MSHTIKLQNTVATSAGEELLHVRPFGPGMGNEGIVVWRKSDEETLGRLLARAYEAGKAARSEELAKLLGWRP